MPEVFGLSAGLVIVARASGFAAVDLDDAAAMPLRTSSTFGLVAVDPSEKTTVGTVRFPLLTLLMKSLYSGSSLASICSNGISAALSLRNSVVQYGHTRVVKTRTEPVAGNGICMSKP